MRSRVESWFIECAKAAQYRSSRAAWGDGRAGLPWRPTLWISWVSVGRSGSASKKPVGCPLTREGTAVSLPGAQGSPPARSMLSLDDLVSYFRGGAKPRDAFRVG